MANYLPVLLVSVSTGMPDDASFQPLPSGQVDYLSHDWQEEDVWRSWRNMTKQKNEIANGVRLENASWRTWWKQRNKLKTISPETLNWLKDSDVTWLYGPLHTAVEWSPPPKRDSTPYAHIISSPSSSTNLVATAQSFGLDDRHRPPATKPILKHRSISEMLTSALPPSPLLDSWEEEDEEDQEMNGDHDLYSFSDDNAYAHPESSRSRPPLLHTKSDSNVLHKFGPGAPSGVDKYVKKTPPPRIIAQKGDGYTSPILPSVSHGPTYGRSRGPKRTSSSGALSDLPGQARAARNQSLYPPHFDSHSTLHRNPTRSGSTDTNGSSRSRSGDAALAYAQASPGLSVFSGDHQAVQPKKHISFNTFVEQCISIDKPDDLRRTKSGKDITVLEEEEDAREYEWRDGDDGYAEDEEDGLFENVQSDTESDAHDEDDDSDDDVLEIRPSSRRSSITLRSEQRPSMRSAQEEHEHDLLSHHHYHDRHRDDRPRFRRTSTSKSGSGSRSSHSQHSQHSSERSDRDSNPYGPPKEHITIAPIAPTILKTAGSDGVIPGSLYFNPSSPYGSPFGSGYFNSTALNPNERNRGGIIPGHYGFEGEDEDPDGMRGACELVYQPPQGSIYSLDVPSVGFGGGFGNVTTPAYGYPGMPRMQGGSPHTALVASPEDVVGVEEEVFDYFTDNRNGVQLPAEGPTTSFPSPSPSEQSRNSQSLSPPLNPRIMELKSEGHSHPSSRQSSSSPPASSVSSATSSPDPATAFPHEMLLPPPTLAIPTPAISPSHSRYGAHDQQAIGLSASSSLSPRGPSPSRGRVPFAHSAASGSSCGSESQSRGRSRNRGSSSSTSASTSTSYNSDDVEVERGRSRSSRSNSTTNSPLSGNGSVSPSSSLASRIEGGAFATRGGAYGSGKEVRDARGRLYRKTSEDVIGERGRQRGREERDSSESLSPPTVVVHGVRPSARSMGSGSSRVGRSGLMKAASYQSLRAPPVELNSTSSQKSPQHPVNEGEQRRGASPSLSASGSSTSTVSHMGGYLPPDIHVHLPPDIPEEEEARSRNPTPANSPVRELRISADVQAPAAIGVSSSSSKAGPSSPAPSPSPRKATFGIPRASSLNTRASTSKTTQSAAQSSSSGRGSGSKASSGESPPHARSASTSSVPSPSRSQETSPITTPTQAIFVGMMSTAREYLGSFWSSGGGASGTPVS